MVKYNTVYPYMLVIEINARIQYRYMAICMRINWINASGDTYR